MLGNVRKGVGDRIEHTSEEFCFKVVQGNDGGGREM